MEDKKFWKWVAETRRAHENTRGDFIRSVRDILQVGGNPESELINPSIEMLEVYKKLKSQYDKEMGKDKE